MKRMLKVSPRGPYQYRMIAEDFVFNTTRIKNQLASDAHQRGTAVTRLQLLPRELREIESRKGVSAHREAARMGVIRVLKSNS
jgi:UDP-glucose 4-epimerase